MCFLLAVTGLQNRLDFVMCFLSLPSPPTMKTPLNQQIVSSGYDRTLESATALLLALYPPGSSEEDVASSTLLWENFIVVPIHSSDPENDRE